MPFESETIHPEAREDAALDLPVLYAERVGLTQSPGTKLTDASGRFIATLFRLADEGNIWRRNPQDAGYRITWARTKAVA